MTEIECSLRKLVELLERKASILQSSLKWKDVAADRSKMVNPGSIFEIEERNKERLYVVDLEIENVKLKEQLEKQQPLSEPISKQCPPNKFRAMSQEICDKLVEKKHLSTRCDFVGVINEIEKLAKRWEDDKLIVVHEYMVPQD